MPSQPAPSARVLVRAAERGADDSMGHPYNPNSELHGWTISRTAGLERIAVNLEWLPPGKEAAILHRHYREEEWIFILGGDAIVEIEEAEHALGAGDFAAFPPGVAHHVRNASDEEQLWFLAGGEIIKDVDVADFPRLRRRMVRYGNRVSVYPIDAEIPFFPGGAEIPPELLGERAKGAPDRLVVRASDRGEARLYRHPQNPDAEVRLQWLSRPALKRISVGVASVPAGRDSFARHIHRHDEEWMYVLSGTGVASLGEREEAIGPGDFLGFPAGDPSHNVRASEGGELTYVLGGDAWSRHTIEIVDLPDVGMRKTFVGTRSAMTFPLDADREP